MWYAAHAIFVFVYEGQESFTTHENIILIEADSEDAALNLAIAAAIENQSLNVDGGIEVNGVPATYVFKGVRKLIEVARDVDSGLPVLRSGIELSYSVSECSTLSDVDALARGDSVTLNYIE